MDKTKWARLPNAAHIDRVLVSIKSHPSQWNVSWKEVLSPVIVEPAWCAAQDTVYESLDRRIAWKEMWEISRAIPAARVVARDALLCLVAYDDCGYMLDSEVDELKILAALGDERAILLLPACIALNAIKELGII